MQSGFNAMYRLRQRLGYTLDSQGINEMMVAGLGYRPAFGVFAFKMNIVYSGEDDALTLPKWATLSLVSTMAINQ